MEVRKPLFIIGSGRCGSTIFHRMLTYHPHTTWLSQLCLRYPDRPELNRLAMRALDLPLPTRYARKMIYSGEFYPFWEYNCKGFSEPCRDLLKEDVTNRNRTNLREVLGKMLTSKRDHLLVKLTGWPRVGFLKEIFPDAKFIHIYRDGRAVANSLLQVQWWTGWKGPANWRWGELNPEQRAKWYSYDQSFVALAAIEWEILMAAYEDATQALPPEDLLEVRYEELCREPLQTVQKTADFAGLKWSPKFEAAVKSFSLKNSNDKWQKDLNSFQQRVLCDCLGATLQKYGYE